MITQCKECGGKVSDQAKSCPHCGAPLKLSFRGKLLTAPKWFVNMRQQDKMKRDKRRIDNQQAREAALRYERIRNFTYESCPYPPPYDRLAHSTIRRNLCSVESFGQLKNVLSAFPTPDIGYVMNLPWLKEWVELHPNRLVDLLFPAFCFSDKDLCDSLLRSDNVLEKDQAVEALQHFARSDADEKVVAFMARYVDMSKEKRAYYSKKMKWLPFIDARDFKSLEFFKSIGLDVRIGDEGVERRKHTDFNLFYSNEYCSPLSVAIDKNDVARVKLLLDWGANPNQMLYFSCGRSPESTPISGHPLLCNIRNREIFDLMVAAGMDLYPKLDQDNPNDRYNLVETLWSGKSLNSEEVAFLEYLYSIAYDKPLMGKITSIRDSVEKHEGRPYDKNIQHVQKWLSRVSNGNEMKTKIRNKGQTPKFPVDTM